MKSRCTSRGSNHSFWLLAVRETMNTPRHSCFVSRLVVIIICLIVSNSVAACPFGCSCANRVWKCRGRVGLFNRDLMRNSTSSSSVVDLDFSHSQLENFYVTSFPRLRILNLSGNNIRNTYAISGRFPNVTHLNLSRNSLEILHRDSLRQFPQLATLDLSFNNIHTLTGDLFTSMPLLQNLNLSNNKLKTLPSAFYQNSLLSLNLQRNILLDLPDDFGSISGNLTFLGLSQNFFSKLPASLIDKLREIPSITLSGNSWDCSCSNSDLIVAFQRHLRNIIDSDATVCSSPSKMANQKLKDLINTNQSECNNEKLKSTRETKEILLMYSATIQLTCEPAGIFNSDVMWITPWGDRFSSVKRDYADDDSEIFVGQSRDYNGGNIFLSSSVEIDATKSLVIHGARGHFSGTFTCVTNSTFNQTVHVVVFTKMKEQVILSVFIGLAVYFGGAIIAISIAIAQVINDRFGQEEITKKGDAVDDGIEFVEPLDKNQNMPMLIGSPRGPQRYVDLVVVDSSDATPDQCKTPDEPNADEEEYDKFAMTGGIMETLDEVRDRLRQGVERRMVRVREQVQTIRDTGNQYMRNIRDSSSTAVHRVRASVESIRETSSQAVGRVRDGVASSVGTMKSHVRSIREFCGTGEMGSHTISTISVSTDIDTDERMEVFKSFTFV